MARATVKIAFDQEVIDIPIADILPLRQLTPAIKASVKYRVIAQSVGEVGVIEPLSVARQRGLSSYLLLDGHVRLAVQVEQGATHARCIIAHDDEAFTHNKRVNRLATIQEHFMIVRAIERGVSEEKLARALNVDILHIKRRRTLLDGICPEVVDILKDRSVNPATFEVLRRMKHMRQIEVADLMVSVGNFTTNYAKALLAATRNDDLANPDKGKKIRGLSVEQMARIEREMEALTRDFKAIEASYGDDVLQLVIASGYLNRLLTNPQIGTYLERHHSEIADGFRSIINAASLDQSGVSASTEMVG